ncbi:polysaccharide deacetylase family protein [Bacillus sp. CGMCC 1.16607]|uniref:polysaccharide deacetylase family protein n=1 Tax=Bacillus sp. CGMCC 1.16607 TaxID=3351842 RepID=UPI003630ADFE
MKKNLLIIFITLFSCIFHLHSVHANTYKRGKFEKTGNVIWDVKTKEKLIAITFDDGPDPIYTPQILNTLKKYDAKATFYVIGAEAERFPDIIKREVLEGHELGYHTYRHYFKDNFNKTKLKNELKHTSNVLKKISGYSPATFRPIAGYYDEQIVNTAVESGYKVILWSWHQDTKDWKKPGIQTIVRNMVSDKRPGDIIIFHDAGGDRSQTVKALENILETLYKDGYRCVTVSEMLTRSDPKILDPSLILK